MSGVDLEASSDTTRNGRSPGVATIVVVGLAAPATVFGLLAVAVGALEADAVDRRILEFSDMHLYDERPAAVANGLLYTAIAAVAGASLLACIVLARQRAWRATALVVLAVGGVLLLDPVMKAIVRRPPLGPHDDEFSFPSGTAMLVVAATTALALLFAHRRRVIVLAGGATALITGAAITYTWWHHPTDVVAGWCAGAAWASALWLTLGRPGRTGADRLRL